jgi:hypothetical protein
MFAIWLNKNSNIKKYESHVEFIEKKPFFRLCEKMGNKLKKIFIKK